jgi:hypothetical protein
VVTIDVLAAIGHHHHPGQVDHPARHERQQVERGLVGPVGVFDDGDGQLGGEQIEERGEQRVAVLADRQQRTQADETGAGDVVERAQRPWRTEGVAEATVRCRPVGELIAEPSGQCGLADACLAGNEHHRAGACGGSGVQLLQFRQERPTLQKVHRRSLRRANATLG